MDTVAGDHAFDLPVVFPDEERAVLIDIDRFPGETVPEGPDIHPVLQRAGEALPLPDDGIVLPAFEKEVMALELL